MATARLEDAVLVVSNGDGQVLGSCFCAPVLDSGRPGTFLISTAHGLVVDARRGDQVIVVDRAGTRHRADVLVCPPSLNPDIGLLYVEQSLGWPVDCVGPPPNDAIVIRGALSGLDARTGTLRGRHSGLESVADEQMMTVVLDDLGFLEPPESGADVRSLAYAGLRGMSGAPVCHTDTGEALVYGMVVRRNIGGIANRVYALPVEAVRRFLGDNGFALRVSQRFDSTSRPTDLLVGRLITRLLDSPGGLHQLWEDTSGLFYSGVPIDAALHEAIRQPERFALEGLRIAEVTFLLARLLVKRGAERDGMELLRDARRMASRSSAVEFRHLGALIDLRIMLHTAHGLSPVRRRSIFEHSVGAFEQIPSTSDDERAYEVASATGTEANQLASEISFVRRDDSARRHFSSLLAKHTGLLAAYPRLLRDKQEIVNIGLSVVDIMWGVGEARDETGRSDQLAELAARGRLAALQRDNGIFYAQMLLAEAMAARESGRSYRAFALICAVGAILSSSGLQLSHEGVRSYLTYVDEHDDVAAKLLRAAHDFDLSNVRTALLGSNLSTSKERLALDAALAWCQSVNADVTNIGDIFVFESLIRDL
jgi:hypothetical protein